MSDDVSVKFSLDVESDASGALGAASALEDLRGKIDNGTKALREMQRAQKRLNQASSVDIATHRQLQSRIDAQKESIAKAQAQYLSLGGTFAKVRRPTTEASKSFGDLLGQAQSLPGPLGSLAGRFGSLSGLVAGGLIAAGIVAIAAALLKLAAAAAKAAAALATYALKQADARRSELLRLEGLTKIRRFGIAGMFGEVGGSSSFIQGEIDRVSQMVATGRDEIAGMARELALVGLKGGNLQAALEGMAITSATQGKQWAQQFKHMALSAALTGQSIQALSDDVKARLGGIAKLQLLELDVQLRKLRENIAFLFSSVKIDGFLRALSKITELFSLSTASGRALKAILDAAFKPIGGFFERVGPIAKRFFQGMIIGALMLTIGILKLRKWLKETFADSAILKGIDLQNAALKAGMFVVGLLAAALVGAAVVAGLLATAFAAVASVAALVVAGIGFLVGALVALGAAIVGGVVQAWNFLKAAALSAWESISSIAWGELGMAIVNGIVDGIKSGAKWVIDALSNLASGGWKAFKAKLGIASPSRLFKLRGGFEIARGTALGIDQGRPLVRRAAERLAPEPRRMASLSVRVRPKVDPIEARFTTPQAEERRSPEPQAASPKLPVKESPPAITSPLIGELHIHAESNDPEELASAVRRALGDALRGVAIQVGAPVEVTP